MNRRVIKSSLYVLAFAGFWVLRACVLYNTERTLEPWTILGYILLAALLLVLIAAAYFHFLPAYEAALIIGIFALDIVVRHTSLKPLLIVQAVLALVYAFFAARRTIRIEGAA